MGPIETPTKIELPSNYTSIKWSIFICFGLTIASLFLSKEWTLPFLDIGPVTNQTLQIALLCFSVYFATTFLIEWFKFEEEVRQKKAWLIDFWITLLIGLSVMLLEVYKIFVEPTGWTPSPSEIVTILIISVASEFIASTSETILWNLKFIRDKDEAEAKQLPRVPVVTQSVIGVFLPINIIIIAIISTYSLLFLKEPLKSVWYFFLICPIIIHFVFSLFKSNKVNLEKIAQAIEWHDTMYVTQGGRYPINNETLLYEAASKGKEKEVREFLEKGFDPDEVNTQGWTPLMISVANGHEDTARTLIHFGANVNHTNTLGRTPLMFASKYGYLSIVRMLLEAGAETNVDDIENNGTPLIAASAANHEEIVKLLLDYGANPNIKDNEGKTALDYSQANGNGELARILRKLNSK